MDISLGIYIYFYNIIEGIISGHFVLITCEDFSRVRKEDPKWNIEPSSSIVQKYIFLLIWMTFYQTLEEAAGHFFLFAEITTRYVFFESLFLFSSQSDTSKPWWFMRIPFKTCFSLSSQRRIVMQSPKKSAKISWNRFSKFFFAICPRQCTVWLKG